MKRICWYSSLILTLVFFGCATPKPAGSRPLTESDKAKLTRRAKPPQTFGLTTYNSDLGPVFAGAFRQHRNHIGMLDFTSPKNTTAPIIAINDGAANMLIDSTAAESWMTVEAMVDLNAMALTGPAPMEKFPMHVADDYGGFAVILTKIILEKAHVENGVFYARNAFGFLDNLARFENEPYVDGVLGADFLRAFEFVQISFKGRQVIVSGGSVYPYAAEAVTKIAITNLLGGIGVEAVISGERMPVLIDLAGDFEVTMERPSTNLLRQVTLGDVVFRRVEVLSAEDFGLSQPEIPRIGRQLLERYNVVINKNGRELLLEMPTERQRPR